MSAPEEFERLEALEQDATPGPWLATMSPFYIDAPDVEHTVCRDQWMRPEDRAFIVAARDALPAALACLTELLALADPESRVFVADDGGTSICAIGGEDIRKIIARHFPGEQT